MPDQPEIRRDLTTDDTAQVGDRFTVFGDPKQLVFDTVPAIDCCAGCDALMNPDVLCTYMPGCPNVIFKVVGTAKTDPKPKDPPVVDPISASINAEVIFSMKPMKGELPVRQDLTIIDTVEPGEVFTTANDPFKRKFMAVLDRDKGCEGCAIPFVKGMQCTYTPMCRDLIFKLYEPSVICRPVRIEHPSGTLASGPYYLVGSDNETVAELWSATPEEMDEIVRLINRP